MPAGHQQRLAADQALQLAERDHRSGKGHRADEHAEEDLGLVDARFDAVQGLRMIHGGRDADQHRRQADKAVQGRDQLRHRRHFDARREQRADRAADHERAGEDRVAVDPRTERRHQHRDRHAEHAEHVAAARRFLRRQPAEAENEKQSGGEIRDRDEGLRHSGSCLCHLRLLWPICGTFSACAE